MNEIEKFRDMLVRAYNADFVPFEQVDLIAKSNQKLDREGVCSALTLQWMANCGSLKSVMQSWNARGSKQGQLQKIQDTYGSDDMRAEYLKEQDVTAFGKPFEGPIGTVAGTSSPGGFMATDWFSYTDKMNSLYYTSLRANDNKHAVGFRTAKGINFAEYRFFDPNMGQFSFRGTCAVTNAMSLAGALIDRAYPNQCPVAKIWRYSLPQHMNPALD
jgi:hypothetical protein